MQSLSSNINEFGAYVIGVGVDLFGPNEKIRNKEKKDVKFSDIFSTDKKSSDKINICKLDDQILGKKLNPFWINLTNQNINDLIWEYSICDDPQKKENDETLIRLFFRKQLLLTDKEREGFAHIKILKREEITISFFIEDEKGEYSIDYDILKWNKSNVDSIKISKNYKKIDFNVYIDIYLFLNIKRKKIQKSNQSNINKMRNEMIISSPASVIAVITPKSVNDEKKFLELLEKDILNNGYVSVGSVNLNINKSLYSINVNNKMRYFPLLSFILSVVWDNVIKKAREILKNKRKYQSKYLNFYNFEKAITELKSYLSFESKIINLPLNTDINDGIMNIEKKEFDDKFLNFIQRFSDYISFSTSNHPHNNVWRRKFLLNSNVFVESDSTEIFINRTIYSIFSPPFTYPETNFQNGIVDFTESGHKWSITWFIMLFSMLCYVSQTFILYDERLSRHIENKKESKELSEITHEAYKDFSEFYDQGVISSEEYRKEFELAKKEFKINEMYETLVRRLFKDGG